MGVRRPSAKGRPTLEEVAALAGVGRGTVSRVINGSPKVSPQARQAVLAAIEQLGYVPNRAARTLVTRRTDTVALVLSEGEQRLFEEPYFADIIRGISSALNETGLQLMFTLAQTPRDHQRLEQYLTGHHVDGVMLISLHGEDPLPGKLERHGVPTVLGGRPVGTGAGRISYVDADNEGGARRAVEYLVGRGRRRIATIAGPQDMGVGIDRLNGYRAALGGLPELVAVADFSEAAGRTAMRELLERDPQLDAVFVASDNMAIGALRTLREAGRRVPDDVAVIGFEDSVVARRADPPLTSVHQPTERMGREMVRLLVAQIKGERPEPAAVVVDTHLVVRDSA
ncbi:MULTISPECIES: LacI family DNA-binding transcriptional regulator [Thermomonospora]|uniref:Transcriptional regulator, LacI family n=1 Tax=Thermomonospora curvata (strain ATCC 19995 / DSM 43183 / JCM 3096 / KCTC 9072 / NBRC 15933 / NCIMB 10081 / Henssen B9) TaxID=471852 RepID=D1AC40_THECD|nr:MULTISPECIES: LacI family DNA-binding transcriptional regulator [Thermomonospora]ACY97306.1 transcriptional regulator, LacI family [Thermomonospora curvata DSM 43183]PKK14674.1 MAG: LacI family transcriptional regulator [Thermomonospora sp. CIF 1]